MSDKIDQPALTDQEQYDLDNHLDAIWEKYCLTNNPTYLANFVRAGGGISDQEKRIIIANVLDTAPYSNRGGAIPEENIETYLAICNLMSNERIGKTAAVKKYAKETILPCSVGGVWDRYRAGKKLLED